MKQHDNRTERKSMFPPRFTIEPIRVNSIEAAKAALPFFGGTAPEAPVVDAPEKDENEGTTDSGTKTGDAPGGDSGTQLTPEQIAAIVANNAQLQDELKAKNKDLDKYTQAEKDAEKAKLGEVERAQAEIAERDETIMSMDRVIRSMAVENAIMNSKDLKFHSAKHVINELDPNAYDIDVDLKSGTANVSNLEKELKRIADANPWMVVDAAKDNPGNGNSSKTGNQNPGGAPRRGSGAPPSPGASRQSDATQRRAELMKKFPVIARGARTG